MELIVPLLERIDRLFKIDTCFVVAGFHVKDYRFQILDSKGHLLKSCLHYQKPAAYQNLPDNIYATGFQGQYQVHPNNRNFLFASVFSIDLQFFAFTPDSIYSKTDLLFEEPLFIVDRGICIVSKQSKAGFQCLDSNQDYVYTLYSGKIKEDFLNDPTTSHLLVFDWEGKPVKRYFLNMPLSTFCLNAAGDKLYGIAFMPETTIVQYDLK
jgi:hypothetical protein